jgi:hypothetical protein
MCVKDGTCTPRGVELHPVGLHQGGVEVFYCYQLTAKTKDPPMEIVIF